MLRTSAAAALSLAALAGSASSAAAQDFRGMQTPSHNIYCMAWPAGGGAGPQAQVRCDLQQMNWRPPRSPDCRLSWGDAFVLYPTGPGRLMCHGDTVADTDSPVVPYGTQWRAYGFTCTSQTTGLTCVNPDGHGFSLSRAVQKVF